MSIRFAASGVLVAELLGGSACRGHVLNSTSISDAGDSADDVTNSADACMGELPSATELASTPRADTNLELLALKLSTGRIVADEGIYQRIVHDVTAIRSQHADLAQIGFAARDDGRTVALRADIEAAKKMQSGAYHAWDCLNATYSLVAPPQFTSIGGTSEVFVSLELEGIYAINLVAAQYARLPGIITTEMGFSGDDGPTICVTAGESTWHYVFDAASGDCTGGCTNHDYS